MELTIEQNCPSCGAPVQLNEADRLITCGFCDVKNYMITKGPLRFILPDKLPDTLRREDLFYIPYLRFKGHIFSCRNQVVEHRIVDTTQLGFVAHNLPISLGLRPQAMKVFPATGNIQGRFLPKTEKMRSIFSKAALLTNALSKQGEKKLYHQSFIGETVSYIYLPVYIKEGLLYDGVLNREIIAVAEDKIYKGAKRFNQEWEPRFLSTICPHCADTLDGEHNSLVLTCPNCSLAWQERDGSYHKIAWEGIASSRSDSLQLPFWRVSPRFNGVELSTFADLLRLSNHPLVIRRHHEELELSMWVPAFKVRPKNLLHLAKGITFSQASIPEASEVSLSGNYPVTLPLMEAKQSLKSILAECCLNKKLLFPMLPQISLKSSKSRLTFLPFNDRGHDFVQEHTGVTVAKAILRLARKM